MPAPLVPVQRMFTSDAVKPAALSSTTPDVWNSHRTDVGLRLGGSNNPDVFLCDIKPFIEHYGPCKVDEGSAEDCLKRMARARKLRNKRDITAEKYEWTDFQILASDSLQEMIDFILREEECDSSFTLTNPSSEMAGDSHKFDACYIKGPCNGVSIESWGIQRLVEGQKQRDSKERAIIQLQILNTCHHILNEDARRMWIFAASASLNLASHMCLWDSFIILQLTFEDAWCSVWYFCRSHSVKTTAFNWITNPTTFVRVLLCFAHASPVELGIDPTVHLGPQGVDDSATYVYEVPVEGREPLYFRTVQDLSLRRPQAIAGRVTRVWEVIQVSSADGKTVVDPKTVVLKDVWLNKDSKTEADNMQAMFASVDKFVEDGVEREVQEEMKANPTVDRDSLLSDPSIMERLMAQFVEKEKRFEGFDHDAKERLRANLTNEKYRSLFLTNIHAWQGQVSKELGPDVSPCRDLFSSRTVEELEQTYDSSLLNNCQQPTLDSATPLLQKEEAKTMHGQCGQLGDDTRRRFGIKRQSRFIYDEVCTTLQNLDTVGDVVDVLCQTVDAMHILLAAGWVHRDISSNNIMAFRSSPDEPWVVKLGDLEFSRPMVDPGNRKVDPRTGTPFFMPVEIQRQRHLVDEYILRPIAGVPFLPQKTLATQLGIEKDDARFSYLESFAPTPFVKEDIPLPTNLTRTLVPVIGSAVIHNYQHDLESIWWILLWFATSHVNCDASAASAAQLFRHDINNFGARVSGLGLGIATLPFLEDLGTVSQLLKVLQQAMFLDYVFRPIFGDLELPESYSNIHANFAKYFQRLRIREGPWRAIKLQHAERGHQAAAVQVPLAGSPDTVAGGKHGRDPSPSDNHHPDKRHKGSKA